MPSYEGLSLDVVKDHLLFSFLIWIYNLLFSMHHRSVIFFYYYKLAEVPGNDREILEIELRKNLKFI